MKIIVQKFGGTSVATPQTRQLVVKKVRKPSMEAMRPLSLFLPWAAGETLMQQTR